MVDPGYGPRCLDLLAQGLNPDDALAQAVAADDGRAVRQVGVVGATGAVASYTGTMCIDHVCHAEGEGYAAQANMMGRDGVCAAMAAAFEASDGSSSGGASSDGTPSLATRLVGALVAAESLGGDARGQMSAALIVVEGTPHPHPWQGVLVDVRVDHHPDPLGELGRLVRVAEAYHLCDVAEESHIAALIGVGRLDEAAAELQGLVASRPTWEGVVRALIDRGLVPLPEGVTVDQLLARPAR
jgi:uncharacterized Ntn-hydrolase superfamily protein